MGFLEVRCMIWYDKIRKYMVMGMFGNLDVCNVNFNGGGCFV